jgi:hypothetical protein
MLKPLINLYALDLKDCCPLKSVEGLPNDGQLTELDLMYDSLIDDYTPLANIRSLKNLEYSHRDRDAVEKLKQLRPDINFTDDE